MNIRLQWAPPMRFDAAAESGAVAVMDLRKDQGGGGAGPTPMEIVLAALAGCTGMDVVSILAKMRAGLEGLSIDASAERAADHPKVFTKLHLRIAAWGAGLKREQVERAVALSQEKYCSVSAMLRRSASITYELTVSEWRPEANPAER